MTTKLSSRPFAHRWTPRHSSLRDPSSSSSSSPSSRSSSSTSAWGWPSAGAPSPPPQPTPTSTRSASQDVRSNYCSRRRSTALATNPGSSPRIEEATRKPESRVGEGFWIFLDKLLLPYPGMDNLNTSGGTVNGRSRKAVLKMLGSNNITTVLYFLHSWIMSSWLCSVAMQNIFTLNLNFLHHSGLILLRRT